MSLALIRTNCTLCVECIIVRALLYVACCYYTYSFAIHMGLVRLQLRVYQSLDLPGGGVRNGMDTFTL